MPAHSSTHNLTGVWQGLYTYPRKLQRVLFGAMLIETASWVTGSTHEQHYRTSETLSAILEGRRNGNAIAFSKTYEGQVKGYGVVHYDGTINADATEIEGRWLISTSWAGKFLMIRATGKTQVVERKAFERI